MVAGKYIVLSIPPREEEWFVAVFALPSFYPHEVEDVVFSVGTALYIHSVLKPLKVNVSRLARGLAVGSQVEYASRAMLEAAITGRTPM